MKDKITNILIGIIISLSMIVSFIFGNIYQLNQINPKENTKLFDKNTNCSGMNLVMTSYCLNNQVKSFFNYNISNIGKDLTIEQLKKEGGVCKNYADYYDTMAKNLGFYSTHVVIDINNETSHGFEVMSNSEGYCLNDQTINFCVPLDLNKSMEKK